MTGFPLIIIFVLAIILMIVLISKFKIHPFIAIMTISVVLGLLAGIPFVNHTDADGKTVQGLANVIGAGFSGTFSSILFLFAFKSALCSCTAANEIILDFVNSIFICLLYHI